MPIRKKGDIEIQASANGAKVKQTGYTFYSYDKKSAALYFQFRGQDGQPTDLGKATIHLVMILNDDDEKEFIPKSDEIEVLSAIRGTAKYVLPEMLLSYSGKVTGYVYMDFDDGSQSDDGQFTFRIKHSMITHVLPEAGDKYVQDFEDVKERVEQAGDSATKDIKQAKDNAESQIGDYVGEVESAKDSALEDIDKALLVDEAKNYTDDKVEEFNETITKQLAQTELLVKKLSIVLTPNGTDDTAQIQTAFDEVASNGGGTITLAHGETSTFNVFDRIYIGSNTTLRIEKGVTVRKCSDLARALLDNKGSLTEGGYNGVDNVVIDGGIWDCQNNENGGNGINFVHCKNITIKNAVLINQYLHAVELNSTDGGLVENCSFYGNNKPDPGMGEALQIDSATYLSGVTDGTISKNITVRNCYFGVDEETGNGCGIAIGSHTSETDFYENIEITKCTIEGTRKKAISGLKWRNTKIKDNIFKNTDRAIAMVDCELTTVESNFIDTTLSKRFACVAFDTKNNITNAMAVIKDNYFKAVDNDAIRTTKQDNFKILDNSFENVPNIAINIMSYESPVPSDFIIRGNKAIDVTKFVSGNVDELFIGDNKVKNAESAIALDLGPNHSCEKVTIDNNRISNTTSTAIVANYINKIDIDNNIISDITGSNGIYCSFGDYINVNKNRLSKMSDNGIVIQPNSEFVTVRDNIFYDNPDMVGSKIGVKAPTKYVDGNISDGVLIS